MCMDIEMAPLFVQPVKRREEWGMGNKLISRHLCATVWVGLFYCKVGVVLIYTWLFIALIYIINV